MQTNVTPPLTRQNPRGPFAQSEVQLSEAGYKVRQKELLKITDRAAPMEQSKAAMMPSLAGLRKKL